MGWAVRVARRGGVLAGKRDGKRPFGRPGRRWKHKRMDPKHNGRALTGEWTL